MRSVILSSIAIMISTVAWAGPNAGGVLAVDALPGITYTDDGSLCALIGDDLPFECFDLQTNLPGGTTEVSLWQIVAIFPNGSSPRLAAVVFGIDYDDSAIRIVGFEPCGDFELHTEEWPGPGSGTNVTWLEAQTDPVTPIYAFAGYEYYGANTSFGFGDHPVGPSGFGDDDTPANYDPIAAFGRLGFNNDPGYAPCFDDAPGACCLPNGDCLVTFQGDCEPAGGQWKGGGTTCDPNPCPPGGACCLADGSCVELTRSDCEGAGGLFFESEPCTDDICDPVPVVGSSWGTLKRTFR